MSMFMTCTPGYSGATAPVLHRLPRFEWRLFYALNSRSLATFFASFIRRFLMSTRLLMISHPATPAQRKGTFPDDEPLDARGIEEAKAFRKSVPAMFDAGIDFALSSPALCARQTAESFGLDAVAIAQDLADTDYARWRGKRLMELAQEEPEALATWTRDPSAAPHGGESFDTLRQRVGHWLDDLPDDGTIIAVTHAPVMRAAMLHVLHAPSTAMASIEVPPLAVIELQRSERGWRWWPALRQPARS
jgi:broad specificity phosphatase PhoE